MYSTCMYCTIIPVSTILIEILFLLLLNKYFFRSFILSEGKDSARRGGGEEGGAAKDKVMYVCNILYNLHARSTSTCTSTCIYISYIVIWYGVCTYNKNTKLNI